jgi:hypothetical protein
MWESRRLLARFPRGSWEGWEACSWLSTLSTAPAFPRLPCGSHRGPQWCHGGGYGSRSFFLLPSVITSKPAIRYHFKTGQRTSLRTLRCCTVPVVIPARVFSIGGDPAGAPQGDRARGISAERFEIPLAGGGALFAPWGEPSPPRLAPGGNGKGGSDSLLPQADFLVRYFMTPLAIG